MGSGGPTILVVDDSPTARLQVRVLLEEAGFQVVEATNGLEGLEEARQGTFAAIVADHNMPVMTGVEYPSGLDDERLARLLHGVAMATLMSAMTED